MKNLDDLLKAKALESEAAQKALDDAARVEQNAQAAQAEAEQRTREDQEVREQQEARQLIDKELSDLKDAKQQLEFIKESLSEEEKGRDSAKQGRQVAESRIDAKSADLEKVGLSKQELLSNPDYQELEEVRGVADASAEEDLYSIPSVGSEALTTKLEKLGVTVPTGEINERAISRAIGERLATVDTNILETRLKIPSERDAVVSDIIAKHRIELNDLPVGEGWNEKGSYKGIHRELQDKLYSVPVVNTNPEVRQAVMQEVVKRVLLDKHKEYKEKKSKVAQHNERLAAYEAAQQKLPEYVAFLNTSFYDAFQERFSKLDMHVAQDVRENNSELKALENTFDINFREGKITGLKLKDNALPSVKQMERHMASSGGARTDMSLSYALKGLERLEGVEWDSYKNRRDRDIFQGNLRDMVRNYAVSETIPQERRLADETYQEWDKAFKAAEDGAERQAQRFTEYSALAEELRSEDVSGARSERDNIDANREGLHTALTRLAGERETEFKIKDGKVINLAWEERKERDKGKKAKTEEVKATLEADLQTLGNKPTGFLSGKKQETWEAENRRLTNEIRILNGEIAHIDEWLKNVKEDWSSSFNLPPELIADFDGSVVRGRDLSEALRGEMEAMEPRGDEVGRTVRANEAKRTKLQELEKARFHEERNAPLYDVRL